MDVKSILILVISNENIWDRCKQTIGQTLKIKIVWVVILIASNSVVAFHYLKSPNELPHALELKEEDA